MKTSRFTEEQIAYVLRQAEAGTPVADVCRSTGIAEATFYVWKKRYANPGRHPCAYDVPSAERFCQRLLRMAGASTVAASC